MKCFASTMGEMDTRRLFAATAITSAGLATCVAASQLPLGNEDVEIACGFFGMLAAIIGLLHPFKLGWRGLALAFVGLLALGLLWPMMH
jgi:hypothetical protein